MKFPLSKPSTPEFIKNNHQCRRSSYAGRGSSFLGNSVSSIKSKRRFSLSFETQKHVVDNNVVDNLDSKQEKFRRVFSFFHKRKQKDYDSSFQSQQQTKQVHVKNYDEQPLELNSPRKRLDNDELMIEAVLRNYPKEKCHSLFDHKKLAIQELTINVTNTSPSDLQKLKVKLIQKLQDSLQQQSSKEEEEEEEEDSSVADSDIMIDENECHSSDTETEITHPLSSRSFLLESAPTSMQSLLSNPLSTTTTTTTTVSHEKNADAIANNKNSNNNRKESTRLITVTNLPIMDEYGMKEGIYTGTICFETGKPHGSGEIQYGPDCKRKGGSYEGEWCQGTWSGFGTHISTNGNVYVGHLLNNLYHGKGRYQYSNSKKRFEGKYHMGERVKGVMKYEDGSVYRGTFNHGRRHGTGTYQFKDGSVYKGSFVRDSMHGIGVLRFQDGSKYIGQWRNGRQNGKGGMYTSKGVLTWEGIWEDGHQMSPRRFWKEIEHSKLKVR